MLPLLLVLLGQIPANEDARTLLERVIEAQELQQTAARHYSFHERTVTRHLDGSGETSKTQDETFLVTPTTGGEYRRLIAKNGEPLTAREQSKQRDELEKHLAEQLRMTPEERERKTRDKLDDRIERYQERLEEAMEVFDFEALSDAIIDGQRLRVFRFSPKPDYEGHSRSTKIFERMNGAIWIDPARNQLAKLTLELTEDLTFLGGLFGRVSKGTKVTIDGELRDELWMLERAEVILNARLYFLKRYRRHITVSYDQYRKYKVDTKEELRPTPTSTER